MKLARNKKMNLARNIKPIEKKIMQNIESKMRDFLGRKSKNIKSINQLAKKFAPSIRLIAFSKGQKIAHLAIGKKYKYYDLASLTKIIFTVSTLMQLVDEKKIRLSDPIAKYLSWWPYKRMRIDEVLSHSAGLTWWAPFYKEWLKNKNFKKNNYLSREQVKRILLANPVDETPKANRKAIYSDLDIILIGFLIEEIYGKNLHEVWLNSKVKRAIPHLHFNEQNKPRFNRNLYAPTEKCPWRKKVLRGEVHDDNTWSFGGVSTHAGLFGRIEDAAEFGLLLRQTYRQKNGSALGKQKTLRQFTKRKIPSQRGDWALSFMLPSKGTASCGKHFSPISFGHTGFTGTSIWYDPVQDLLVVILSNRVHPSRKHNTFVKLRPLMHDSVVEALLL